MYPMVGCVDDDVGCSKMSYQIDLHVGLDCYLVATASYSSRVYCSAFQSLSEDLDVRSYQVRLLPARVYGSRQYQLYDPSLCRTTACSGHGLEVGLISD